MGVCVCEYVKCGQNRGSVGRWEVPGTGVRQKDFDTPVVDNLTNQSTAAYESPSVDVHVSVAPKGLRLYRANTH